MQQDWPKETLQNRNGSPALAAAASMRGTVDLFRYVLDDLQKKAEKLELLERFNNERLGPDWIEEFNEYVQRAES